MTKIQISLVNYLPEDGPRRPKHVVEVLNIYTVIPLLKSDPANEFFG